MIHARIPAQNLSWTLRQPRFLAIPLFFLWCQSLSAATDLAIDRFITTPSDAKPGMPISASVRIKNRGTDVFSGTVTVRIEASGQTQDIVLTAPASPWPHATGTFSLPRTDGRNIFKATIDPSSSIPDSNRSNNVATSTVTVDGTPPRVWFSLSERAVVKGYASIPVAAQDNFAVNILELWHAGARIGRHTGASTAFRWDTKALINGPYSLEARAFDKAYNMSAATITVVVDNPPPLPPTLPKLSHPYPRQIDVTWSSGGGTVVGYYLDASSSPVFDCYLPGRKNLKVSFTGPISLIDLAPGTTYYARVRSYVAGSISDYSPTASAVAQGFPDLVPTGVSLLPPVVQRGNNAEATVRLKNIGQGFSPTFHVGFAINGSTYAYTYFGPLAAGAEGDMRVTLRTSALPPGAHGLRVIADIQGSIRELREDNNVLTFPFLVDGPSQATALASPVPEGVAVSPNPVRKGRARVRAVVGAADSVRLSVMDVRGRVVRESEMKALLGVSNAGEAAYEEELDFGDLSSGVYLCTVEWTRSGQTSRQTQKILLLR